MKPIQLTFLVIFSFSFITSTFSQFKDKSWIIEYNDGSISHGKVDWIAPVNDFIKFKNADKKKREKIDVADVKTIMKVREGDTLFLKKMTLKAMRGMKWEIKEVGQAWVSEVYSTDKIESYSVVSTEKYRPISPFPNTHMPQQTTFVESFAIRVLPEDYIINIGAGHLDGAINGKKVARSMFNIHLKRYLEKYCPEFAKGIDKKTYEITELEKVMNDFTKQCN